MQSHRAVAAQEKVAGLSCSTLPCIGCLDQTSATYQGFLCGDCASQSCPPIEGDLVVSTICNLPWAKLHHCLAIRLCFPINFVTAACLHYVKVVMKFAHHMKVRCELHSSTHKLPNAQSAPLFLNLSCSLALLQQCIRSLHAHAERDTSTGHLALLPGQSIPSLFCLVREAGLNEISQPPADTYNIRTRLETALSGFGAFLHLLWLTRNRHREWDPAKRAAWIRPGAR